LVLDQGGDPLFPTVLTGSTLVLPVFPNFGR